MQNKIILLLSLPLAVLIFIVSCFGLLTPDFYVLETLNWQAQSTGQDLIDLFLITPCLLIVSVLAYKNNRIAIKIWGGIVLYLSYTFALYCFDVHFNKMFILYCFCLGLSIYSLLYFLYTSIKINSGLYIKNKTLVRLTGKYFIVIAVLFYFLWLAEIVPAIIQNKLPVSIGETGLFTNGVHVIDLAIILPAIFITGLFLLQKKSLGFILTPMILTFFILMDFTIGILTIVMEYKGIESNLILTLIIGLLALISMILLILFFRSIDARSNL